MRLALIVLVVVLVGAGAMALFGQFSKYTTIKEALSLYLWSLLLASGTILGLVDFYLWLSNGSPVNVPLWGKIAGGVVWVGAVWGIVNWKRNYDKRRRG